MRRNIVLAGIVIAVLVLLGVLGYTIANQEGDDAADATPTAEVLGTNEGDDAADVEEDPAITYEQDGTIVTYGGEAGVTALATLRSLTEVTTETSDFGEFVTGINGVEADPVVEFWGFYVNEEMAAVGASDYVAMEGDVIEWRLEAIE